MKTLWMIYGANGYTGRLLAQEAHRQGLTPLLAGRNASAVETLAGELQLEARVFDLHDAEATRTALVDVAVVAHCAGPFSATSAPLIAACLASRSHYVDITGEISVFEHAHSQDDAARSAGVVVCPGVGFDVIPTDCVAASLKLALPDATHLALGFDTSGSLSPGTAKTSVESLPLGGQIRRDGRLIVVPLCFKRRTVDFGRGAKAAVTIPWGDLATAYYSTGIDNIEVYLPAPLTAAFAMRLLDPLRGLLGRPQAQQWLKAQVDRRVTGPSPESRARAHSWVWGEARNAAGEVRIARLQTANGYDVTVHGALLAVRHLLDYSGPGGYFTPTGLLGPRCVEQLPGSGAIVIG